MNYIITVVLLLTSFTLFADNHTADIEQKVEEIEQTVSQNKTTIETVKGQNDEIVSELQKQNERNHQQSNFKNAAKYVGDKLSFPFDIPSKTLKLYDGDGEEKALPTSVPCLPAGLQMRVLTEPDQDGKVLAVILPGEYWIECGNKIVEKVKYIQPSHPLANQLIKMPVSFADAGPRRTGLTYGTLFVPYKTLLSGSKSLKGSVTIGPYMGYLVEKGWFASKLILFAGPTIIENSTVVDGELDTDSLFGLSYGFGFLGEIKDEFQFGLVFGADRVSKGSDYEDNGKAWISLALGYEFN